MLDVDIQIGILSEELRKLKSESTHYKQDNSYYVYEVYVNDELSYIGKGKGGRFKHPNSGVSNIYELNKAHFEGKDIVTKIFRSGLTNYEAKFLEKDLINLYKEKCDLFNKLHV